jgi:hypothetical protein
LFSSFICLAQKEQFIGLSIGSAKYIDDRVSGTSFSAFYEVRNSPYWIFGFDIYHSFVDVLPTGLNIGSHNPLTYRDEVNNYFTGTSVTNASKDFFSNYDLHFTCYANFVIPINNVELIPAIGVGYGHMSTLHFLLTSWEYSSRTNLITKVNDFSVAHWQRGVLNISPKIRLVYNLNKKVGIYIASKILLNAAYDSSDNFDLGYTGTWSHNLGIRLRI